MVNGDHHRYIMLVRTGVPHQVCHQVPEASAGTMDDDNTAVIALAERMDVRQAGTDGCLRSDRQ